MQLEICAGFRAPRDEPGTIGRVQRRAPASLILRLSGFLGLFEASTIGVLRNLAALLRRYQLQRRTFVPEFAGSVGSLRIFLFHSLIASAFLGGFPALDEKDTLARYRSKNAHVTSLLARLAASELATTVRRLAGRS